MKKNILNIVVPLSFNDYRIDKFLQSKITELSRTRLQSLIHGGEVKLNNAIIDSPAKKIKEKDEIKINFQDDAYKAHKKICAFSPKPGAWFDLNSSKYKIFDSQVVKEKDLTNINKNKDLILKFKKDYLLVKKIQKEGKKIMSVEEFGRGYSNELEEIIKKFE